MKNGHVFFEVLAVFAMILFLSGPAALATNDKESLSDPKAIPLPDLEKDPGFLFLMAENSEAAGDHEAVMKYLRQALALDPTSAYLNTHVGTLLARNRKIADALIIARTATLFDPENDAAYTLLGKIYTVTNDRARATDAYSRALELKPDDRDLYVFLGSLQASQDLLGDAEKTFLKMIKQFPEEREGYFYLGKVYVEDKQYQTKPSNCSIKFWTNGAKQLPKPTWN